MAAAGRAPPPGRARRPRREPSALHPRPQADARVDERIRYVDQQISDDERRRGDEHDRHDRVVVAREHGAEGVLAHAGYAQQRLQEDRPAEEADDREPHHRRQGEQGVAGDVPADDGELLQPLRPGGAHVVLVQHLQHLGPHVAGHAGEPRQGEDQQRQDDALAEDADLDAVELAHLPAAGRQQVQLEGEQPLQHGDGDEDGYGREEQHDADGERVQPRALLERRPDPRRYAHREDDDQRQQVVLERYPEAREQNVLHGEAAGAQPLAEVALDGALHVAPVLGEKAIVVAQLLGDALALLRVAVLALEDLYRVARPETAEGEGGQRDGQQDYGRPQKPPDDVGTEPLHGRPRLAGQADVAEVRYDERRDEVALYVRLDEGVVLAVVERDPGHVLHDLLLRLLVQAKPRRLVLLRPRLLQQVVYLRVGVLRLVVGAVGVELDVEEVLRVHVVGDPAQVEHREVAVVQVPQKQAELLLVDLDGDAQVVLPHRLDRFDDGADAGAAAGREEADIAQAAWAAGVVQQLPRAARVEGYPLQVFVEAGHSGRQHPLGGHHQLLEHHLRQHLLVDRHGEGAAHVRVVERGLPYVEADVVRIEAGGLRELRVQRLAGVEDAREVGYANAGFFGFLVLRH